MIIPFGMKVRQCVKNIIINTVTVTAKTGPEYSPTGFTLDMVVRDEVVNMVSFNSLISAGHQCINC